MVNLQKFLSEKGLPTEDATALRSQIRLHLASASTENRIPGPAVRKSPYKPVGDKDRTKMDELTDELRATMKAQRIPSDIFASVVKMVLSSDISDLRQKEKRAIVKLETAMVARSTGKVLYQVAKTVEKSEILKLDEAFANLDTADVHREAAGLHKSTAEIDNCKSQMDRTTASVTQATANVKHATANVTEATASVTQATANVILATATKTQSALEQCQQLDIQIKQAQLVEARTRAALATLEMHQAQAAAATLREAEQTKQTNSASSTNTVVSVVPVRARQRFTREVSQGSSSLSMPAVRPVPKKKGVVFKEGTKAR